MLVLLLGAVALLGCGGPAPSGPTESPAAAPTIRLGDWQATNGRWTFTATVNPRGSPTDVVLEYGLGSEAAPVFDKALPVETGLLDPKALTANLELPADAEFCVRFTATNEVGSGSSQPYCSGARPSNVIVMPPTSDDPGASASPSP